MQIKLKMSMETVWTADIELTRFRRYPGYHKMMLMEKELDQILVSNEIMRLTKWKYTEKENILTCLVKVPEIWTWTERSKY